MDMQQNWYWSESLGGYRLKAFTLSAEVAQKSAEQWQRTLECPCYPVELADKFAGQTAWSVLAVKSKQE